MGDFSQIAVNALFAASVYSLVGLGFRLVYLPTRMFHFAHGAVITAGAYAAYASIVMLELPVPLAMICAVAVAAAFGIMIEIGVYEPLRRSRVERVYLLLASLACLVIATNLLAVLFGPAVIFLRTARGQVFSVGNATISAVQLTIVLVSIVVAAWFGAFLKWTTMGSVIRALGNDSALARAFGVEDRRVYLVAFGLASAAGGAIGALVAYDTGATPFLGFDLLILGVVVALVGGARPVLDTLAASVSMSILEQVVITFWTSAFRQSLALALLVVVLVGRRFGSDSRRLRRVTL